MLDTWQKLSQLFCSDWKNWTRAAAARQLQAGAQTDLPETALPACNVRAGQSEAPAREQIVGGCAPHRTQMAASRQWIRTHEARSQPASSSSFFSARRLSAKVFMNSFLIHLPPSAQFRPVPHQSSFARKPRNAQDLFSAKHKARGHSYRSRRKTRRRGLKRQQTRVAVSSEPPRMTGHRSSFCSPL